MSDCCVSAWLRQGSFVNDAKQQKSKYRGVSHGKKGWAASLQNKGKRTFCGWHTTEEAAKKAYDDEARKQGLLNRIQPA